MNSLSDSIDALIENIKVSEHYAESQRKQLQNMENETMEIKAEIASMRIKNKNLTTEVKEMLFNVNEKEALLLSLEKEIKILFDVQKNMKELYEKENKILNEKQQQVWMKRESFCNQCYQFSEEWGPLGTSWLKEPENVQKIKSNEPELKGEEYLLCQSVKKLEEEVEEAKKQLSEIEQKLNKAKLRKELLSSDPDCGEEFIQLQTQLRKAQIEVESLENQSEHTREHKWCQQLLSKNMKQQTLHLMPSSANTATLVLSHKKESKEPFIYNKIQNRDNHCSKSFLQDTRSINENVQNMNTKTQGSLKRPVTAIAPAIENYLLIDNEVEDQCLPSRSKQPCPFIPKKPTSLCKKILSRSSGWMQLENELSALLQKNLTTVSKQVE